MRVQLAGTIKRTFHVYTERERIEVEIDLTFRGLRKHLDKLRCVCVADERKETSSKSGVLHVGGNGPKTKEPERLTQAKKLKSRISLQGRARSSYLGQPANNVPAFVFRTSC
jgi:hypothetical protein